MRSTWTWNMLIIMRSSKFTSENCWKLLVASWKTIRLPDSGPKKVRVILLGAQLLNLQGDSHFHLGNRYQRPTVEAPGSCTSLGSCSQRKHGPGVDVSLVKTNVLKIAKMMKNHRKVTTFMPLLFFFWGGEVNRQWGVWMSWISMQQKCLNQQQLGDATVELEASNAYDEHLAHHVNKIHSYFTGKSEAESFLGKLKIVFNTKKMWSLHTSAPVSVLTRCCNNFISPLILWFAISAEATWSDLKSLWLFRGLVVLVRKGHEGKGKIWGP